MYKSKLQELCHQRSWGLPEYAAVKEGPDHMPRFTGTVSVNGVSFRTPDPCKSSKEAQNEAARLAFDHWSAPRPPPREPPRVAPPPPPPPSGDGGDDAAGTGASSESTMLDHLLADLQKVQPKKPEINEISEVAESHLLANLEKQQPELPESNEMSKPAESSSIANNNTTVKDMQHLYKNQLQTFAQKRNLALPTYCSEHEGPPHARRFRCKVSIDGRTYETVEFFNTLKEAEHAAARIALMSLSSDTFQEVDCGLYKSLLQEFTQKQGHSLPVYDTVRCGESHIPIFISTVEIEGESFKGQEARTKKMAETSAAKVAYIILKERTSGKISASSTSQSPVLQREKAALSSHCSLADDSTGYQQKVTIRPTPNVISNHSGSDGKQIDDNENVEASHHNLPGPSSGLDTFIWGSTDQFIPNMSNAHLRDPSLAVPSSSEDASSSSSSLPHFTDAVNDSTAQLLAELNGLSKNVVRVYPCKSNMAIPLQRIVRRDENWVAVSADPSYMGHAT
ncbi:double-stranded RNA-binding protein 1-like isoform X1 [Syzygium oleosum]|uniref:double-stranded RNA-binding protein 1-like isoform X1 n=1 Tax=Syzygium oleosum TaxID=219896 RepID=UPI0024BB6E0E|nr:double-stranded RNA-binding protein 1-like isoform X1 [Syzygium oleosum]XP_056171505.1 double-stranded RNA-binding protein 1-like isoform X1 [Syzygium oleosum]